MASAPSQRKVMLSDITVDADLFQIREMMNEDAIADHITQIAEGITFPAVQIVNIEGDLVLADGFHRYEALKRSGASQVSALVYEGNRALAIQIAMRSNSAHGVRLGPGDKRRAAIMYANAVGPGVNKRQLASDLCVSHRTVQRWLADSPAQVQEETQPAGYATPPTRGEAASVLRDDDPVSAQRARTLEKLEQLSDGHSEAVRVTNVLIGRIDELDREGSVDLREQHQQIRGLLEKVKEAVSASAPHEPCPHCDANDPDACRHCRGRGWITRQECADPSNRPTQTVYTQAFEAWWESYPTRGPHTPRGDKRTAFDLWERLGPVEHPRIIQATQRLIESGDLPCDAERFLRPRRGGKTPQYVVRLDDSPATVAARDSGAGMPNPLVEIARELGGAAAAFVDKFPNPTERGGWCRDQLVTLNDEIDRRKWPRDKFDKLLHKLATNGGKFPTPSPRELFAAIKAKSDADYAAGGAA